MRLVPLNEATELRMEGQKINVLGSAIEFSFPRKCEGPDYFYTLKIVDKSVQDPAVVVNFFARKMEYLPHVRSVGDIVLLCDVVVKLHEEEVYLTFSKAKSSFALFDGKPSPGCNIPYQASSRFPTRGCDENSITELRAWLDTYQVDAGKMQHLMSLKEIKNRQFFDLICKVVHVSEVSKNKWLLYVWDGTDTPPLQFSDEEATQLPLQPEETPLPRDILCRFPHVGSILRVSVSCERLDVHLFGNGQWVRLRSMLSLVTASFWRGELMNKSRFRVLSEGCNVVAERLSTFNGRISSTLGRLPLSTSLCPSPFTVLDPERLRWATLMDVLTHPEVTAGFKCVVRVLELYPSRVEKFRSPDGKYRIKLTLEDPTARIHANLYAEDGEKFFDGCQSTELLSKKINQLLGVTTEDEGSSSSSSSRNRNPPWVQCCIMSYYIEKDDQWGTRKFRIYHTRFVDQAT